MTLLLLFLIGFFAGLRSLTPPALVAWATHLGWLPLQGGLAFMGSVWAVAPWTVLMIGELAADKWARIPNRTTAMPLIARILTGGLAGACLAVAGGVNPALGAALGGAGGVVGAFTGFHARRKLTRDSGLPDFPVAVVEDLVAIGGCLWLVTRA